MAWLRTQPSAELATTAVTLAKINYGRCRLPAGRRRDDLARRIGTFIARGFGDRVLPFDRRAAGIVSIIEITRAGVALNGR